MRVVVDSNAVALTQQAYQTAAAGLLNRSESLNGDVGDLLTNAQTAEEGDRSGEALTLFSQARSGCDEVVELLRTMTDDSILSDSGASRSAVLAVTSAQAKTADAGIARVQAAAKSEAVSDASREMEGSYSLLSDEISTIENLVSQYVPLSPFYDLPKQQLEAVQIDLNDSAGKSKIIRSKLDALKTSAAQQDPLLVDKVTLSLTDLDRLDAHVTTMLSEVTDELNYPRLARQQDAYNRAEMVKAIGGAVGWVFLHPPSDIVAFRYELPFEVVTDQGFDFTDETDLQLSIEGTFASGFWVRTILTNDDDTLFSPGVMIQALRQEADLGFFKDGLFGIGFQWDWDRQAIADSKSESLPREYTAMLHMGALDAQKTWPSVLFTLAYQIPDTFSTFILP